MAVYRPDPPVRLPAVGIAALLAIAASVPVAAQVQQAAYLRDVTFVRAPGLAVAAVFAPADPAYTTLAPPPPQAAYRREQVQQRVATSYVPQVAATVLAALSNTSAAYARSSVAPWVLQGTWTLYAPVDPAYQFSGPLLQTAAAYRRDASTATASPVYAIQVASAMVPQAVIGAAAYVRVANAPWTMQAWFATYAPADPSYQFSGPVLQPSAAYRREPTTAAPLLVFAAPPASSFLPAPPAQRGAYSRVDSTPWTMQETWALYAPADPPYQFGGISTTSALYVRVDARVPLRGSYQIAQPTGYVPFTTIPTWRRDPPPLALGPPGVAAVFAPVGSTYPFVFRGGVATAYARVAAGGQEWVATRRLIASAQSSPYSPNPLTTWLIADQPRTLVIDAQARTWLIPDQPRTLT